MTNPNGSGRTLERGDPKSLGLVERGYSCLRGLGPQEAFQEASPLSQAVHIKPHLHTVTGSGQPELLPQRSFLLGFLLVTIELKAATPMSSACCRGRCPRGPGALVWKGLNLTEELAAGR